MEREAFENKKDGKLMPQILKMLEAQGGESLKEARKRLTAIGVQNSRAFSAIEMYASSWNDYVHPAILSLSFDAVSKKSQNIIDLQVMILLQTAAMDIHDDVMDKSKMKNGKPTLYGKFGEDMAILVGDAFLMESFLMLPRFRCFMEQDLFEHVVAVVRRTLLEVGNAHLLELELKDKPELKPQEIVELIEKKAAIFEGISEIGATVAFGSPGQVDALKVAARAFGYLVMLREEFIDMFEPLELSSRLRNEYAPLPIVCSIEDPKVKEYLELVRKGHVAQKTIQELVETVLRNQNVVRLKETMELRATQAVQLLKGQHLKRKPVSLLATLIQTTLEDL